MKKATRVLVIGLAFMTAMALASGFAGGEKEGAGAAGETPTLHVATHTGWAASLPPANNDLPVYKEYEKLTGIRIEWDNIQVSNYQEVMRARLAAGMDLPDIVNMSMLGDISEYGRDGLIIPQNDLIEEHAPNIKKWFETPGNEIYKVLSTSPDGNIYGVPSYVLPQFLSMGYLWNKPWLDAVGIDRLPETQEEMLEALRAFRDQDPNGNGKADEIPLTPAAGAGYLNILSNQYGFEYSIVSQFQVDDRGQVYWAWTQPRMKDLLEFMNQLYSEGLLDKAYASDSWTETAEKVGNDVAGLITCWATFTGTYSGLSPHGDPDGQKPVFVNGPPIEGPYGDKYFVRREITAGDTMAITKDCDQPETAMRWIDFVRNSEEALWLQNFGIEGVSYEMQDGKVVPLSTEEKSFSDLLLEVGGSQPPFSHLQWDRGWELRFPDWAIANDRTYYYRKPSFPQIPATKDEQEKLNALWTDLDTYRQEWYHKFITGQEPLSKFDEFVENLKRLGADEVVAVRQQQYERYLELAGQ